MTRSSTAAQEAVIAFLANPQTYGVDTVERVETHGAIVFLAGDRAYKLKRAVRYPYLDFSTLEKRQAACEAELRINRRTAPALYLDVLPVTRRRGRFGLGGEGAVVDWVVVMQRFDQETLFDRLATEGRLDDRIMLQLADAVAGFHAAAELEPGGGGASGMAAVVDGNTRALRDAAGGIWTTAEIAAFDRSVRAALDGVATLLDRRAADCFVRRCHGDLHLRNICLIQGQPTLFDAIEFDEALATIDVMYDLAFLLMDLDHRALRPLANAVFNRYLMRTEDLSALAALPLFLACRASVRAHVTATAAGYADPSARAGMAEEARRYLSAARTYLTPPKPVLVAIGGLSGTGKSTVAHALAPPLGAVPGAVVVRSDVIRKRMHGADPFDALPQEAYVGQTGERVYARMREQAEAALAAGHAVIADAVHLRPEERTKIAAVASACGVPFAGLWLDAPASLQEARVGARRDDPSDATVAVLRRQQALDPGAIAWVRISTAGTREESVARARAAIAAAAGAA